MIDKDYLDWYKNDLDLEARIEQRLKALEKKYELNEQQYKIIYNRQENLESVLKDFMLETQDTLMSVLSMGYNAKFKSNVTRLISQLSAKDDSGGEIEVIKAEDFIEKYCKNGVLGEKADVIIYDDETPPEPYITAETPIEEIFAKGMKFQEQKDIVEFIQKLKCLNPTYIMDLSDGDRKVVDYFWIKVLIEKYEEMVK